MRIEKLVLRNVGPFGDAEIEFLAGDDPDRADVHLLVGENGTGKTTILRCLASAFDPSALDEVAARFRKTPAGCLVVTDEGGALGWGNAERVGFESDAKATNYQMGGLWQKYSSHQHALHYQFRRSVEASAPATAPWHQSVPGGPGLSRDAVSRLPIRFVGLSYGASRLVSGHSVAGSQPLQGHPLYCLGADNEAGGSGDLARWLINARLRSSAARDQGDEAEAERYLSTLRAIESALTEILEAPTTVHVPAQTLDARLRIHGDSVPLHLLPDGLRSILSWIGDVFMRVERIPWADETPLQHRQFALFIDEVEAHLHPRWQRKVLHAFQDLFPRAQVIASTHSPDVIASVSDAWIHPLTLDEHGRAHAEPPIGAQDARSVVEIRERVLGVREEFGIDIEERYDQFKALRQSRLQGDVGV